MHRILALPFRNHPAGSRVPARSSFHHLVAQRTAGYCVWYFLMPLTLLSATRADFRSLAVFMTFCAVAYVAVYGGVYVLSVVAPFFGSNTMEAGGRAMDVGADNAFHWRVAMAPVIQPVRVRPLLPACLTIADVLDRWLRSLLPALWARLRRSAVPALKTAAPFRLFPFAPLRLPWLLS